MYWLRKVAETIPKGNNKWQPLATIKLSDVSLRWSGKERDCTWQAWLDLWLWRWPQPEIAKWAAKEHDITLPVTESLWRHRHILHIPTLSYTYRLTLRCEMWWNVMKCDEMSCWGATAKTMKPALKVESTSKQVVTPPCSVRQETLVFCSWIQVSHPKISQITINRPDSPRVSQGSAWHLVSQRALREKSVNAILGKGATVYVAYILGVPTNGDAQ